MTEARAFVCGWPIRHSRSPLIHGTWLKALGLPGRYERAAVEPDAFGPFIGGLRQNGYVGGNVTIPHKEAAFDAVARRDSAAAAIGAVNTLWFEDDTLVGGNTDAYGFSANCDERLDGWRAAETALVLGAGGAARAVVQALREAGVRNILVTNRTAARASALAASFGAGVAGFAQADEAALLSRADLLVNTRPSAAAGAREADDAMPNLSAARDDALATDIVYVPLETPFLLAAKERGLRTADGLGMLLHQAVPGFERWFGRRPVVDEALRNAVLRDIEEQP